MGRHKKMNDDLLMGFGFLNEDSATGVNGEVSHASESHHAMDGEVKQLPILPEEEELGMFEQVDILLQQIGETAMNSKSKLYDFILRSFYVEGKSVAETAQMLLDGVKDVPCVTRERVRMIVAEMRDEILAVSSSKKLTRGIVLRTDFVETMTKYAASHTGHVVKDTRWTTCPRIGAIAYLLRKKVVAGDTVIPWVKREKILVDESIDKAVFNAHYAGLFYLLQREVRPMAYEDILRGVPHQKRMKGVDAREDLLRVLLQHDEVFEEVADGVFRLREEHLNVTQRVARIIFEERDITSSDLQRIYAERHGGTFSSLATAGRMYPWCVPVGKSKWVYREDGERLRMPADVIREYCREHVRFTMQDVCKHLDSQGVNIRESSVRCYILRDCRPLNSDGKTFCLVSAISEADDHLWRSKYVSSVRSRNKAWKGEMAEAIRRVLESAPMQRMLQKEVLHQCRHILEHEGIAYNNFYKMVKSLPWLKAIVIDGKTHLELNG